MFGHKWHERFRSGGTSIEDDERLGRPLTVVIRNKNGVGDLLIKCDRRMTAKVVSDELGMSCSAVYQALTDELGMFNV